MFGLEESHLYSYETLNKVILQYSKQKANNLAMMNLEVIEMTVKQVGGTLEQCMMGMECYIQGWTKKDVSMNIRGI